MGRGVKQQDQKIRKYEDGSDGVIGALITVHRELGPGLLESAYEACFCRELHLRGLAFQRQLPVGINYKGLIIDCGYRVDVLVERRIVVELKAVERLLPLHTAQVLTYMKLAQVGAGLLVTFNVTSLRQGLRRLSLPTHLPDLPDLPV
jgi:GxxExxY protein